MSKKPMTNETPIQHIPLSQIDIDDAWNARHINHKKEGDNPEDDRGTHKGIISLSESIGERGQDTPVVVRLHPDEKKRAKTPYKIVTGNRRAYAILMLASRSISANDLTPIKSQPDWNAKTPYVRAEVRVLSESEALMLNLAENTARDDMPAADVAFGAHRLLAAYKAEKAGKEFGSATQIAKAIGKSEAYTGRLLKIMNTLDQKITDHWRSATKQVPVQAMFELCDETKVRPDDRWEKYAALSGQKDTPVAGTEGTPGETEKTPLETMAESLTKATHALGRLHRLGHIDCAETVWTDQLMIKELINVKKKEMGDDPAKWKQLYHAAKAGFEAGSAEVDKEAETKAAKELVKNGKEKDPKTGTVLSPTN